jgi:hypothetical protein
VHAGGSSIRGKGFAVDAVSIRRQPIRGPAARSRNLVEDLLAQACHLRELAKNTDDVVVVEELLDAATRCDGAASTILSHWNGQRDQLMSAAILLPKSLLT